MAHLNNLIFGENNIRSFQVVNKIVVKVPTYPTRMWFPAVWRCCKQWRFSDIAENVPQLGTVPFSHRIDDVKSIDSPNNGQYKLVVSNLLFNLLRDTVARHSPFRQIINFQSQLNLIARDNFRNSLFSWAWRLGGNSRQFSTRTRRNLSVNSWGIYRKWKLVILTDSCNWIKTVE
jgi:hypothetical protein